MFEGFVHPALAFGTALASVPLIIHLLNRQRHRPVKWAAMRWVLAAYRKTRRRVQLENLLLLLLRMAAVALLALAVARPFASGDSPLSSLTETRRDVVLVLDSSMSTGYREDVETVFERIVERAGALMSSLDGTGGDRVQVIVAGSYPRLSGWMSPDKALSVLSLWTAPTDERLDLAAALSEVLDIVAEDAAGTGQSELEVRFFTDLQRDVFESAYSPVGDDPDSKPLLVEQLDALEQYGVRVIVEDFGPAPTRPTNLAIESVVPLTQAIGAEQPLEIAVSVVNHGDSPRPAQRVSLYVDGAKQPVQRVDVPAGGHTEVIFTVTFEDAGAHSLTAALDGDKLKTDDSRTTVLHVPPPIRILVVNGNRADDIVDDETGFFMVVLEPPGDDALPGFGGATPFDPREITPDLLVGDQVDLADFDVIVLANVGTVPDAVVPRLEERIAAGASLIVTSGDRMADLVSWNSKLYRPDGTGLLPAELTHKVSAARRENYYRVASFDEVHPALALFADDRWKPLLTEVPIYDFIAARPLASATVVATLDDELSSPLLVERSYDRGKVFLWTTSLNRAWTRIPDSPKTFIPLVHDLVRHAGTRRFSGRNVAPGDPVVLEVESFPRSPELVPPRESGLSPRPIDGEPEETAEGRWRLPEIDGSVTERAGRYEVRSEGQRSEPFAVQLVTAESDLSRMTPDELDAVHPALVVLERGATEGGADDNQPQRGELWRWLALLCLIALVAESLWGAWLGQRRRLA